MTVSDDRNSPWIRCYRPAPDAEVQLLCLPHAGGSAPFYLGVAEALHPTVDVLAVQYPGRQERLSEPPIESIPDLAEQLLAELLPWTDRPLAVFGHSLGALLGYEVARRLSGAGRPPLALFASGRRAPSIVRPETAHRLNDRELLRELAALGGTDRQVLENEDLMELALPAIRADYRAVDAYRHRPGPPLACPVTVLTGADDPKVTAGDAEAWRTHTRGPCEVITLPGGHFYLIDQRRTVNGLIVERLARLTGVTS